MDEHMVRQILAGERPEAVDRFIEMVRGAVRRVEQDPRPGGSWLREDHRLHERDRVVRARRRAQQALAELEELGVPDLLLFQSDSVLNALRAAEQQLGDLDAQHRPRRGAQGYSTEQLAVGLGAWCAWARAFLDWPTTAETGLYVQVLGVLCPDVADPRALARAVAKRVSKSLETD